MNKNKQIRRGANKNEDTDKEEEKKKVEEDYNEEMDEKMVKNQQ